MPPTPLLPFSLEHVRLAQGESLEPFLIIVLKATLAPNGNNAGISEASVFSVKTKVYVSLSRSWEGRKEIGIAESLPFANFQGAGAESSIEMYVPLSQYLLRSIEEYRNGGDLCFSSYQQLIAYGSVTRNGVHSTEPIWINAVQEKEIFKYARSEWIDALNTTDYSKIELFEMPAVSLAQVSVTSDVTRFLREAERSMKEGRWDDVFGECRKAMTALYKGIDEWGATQTIPKEELESIKGSEDNGSNKKDIYFKRLLDHPEKGERLNKLRTGLYRYLSLDPHEADYKGISFTRDDASFALRITYGFVANVLSLLAYRTKPK